MDGTSVGGPCEGVHLGYTTGGWNAFPHELLVIGEWIAVDEVEAPSIAGRFVMFGQFGFNESGAIKI